ncbi:MAG: hypothetical protein L0177_04355 [Chloroflexi bacterium]|nr:hypothetical protein [Chloroflexota bacterium]
MNILLAILFNLHWIIVVVLAVLWIALVLIPYLIERRAASREADFPKGAPGGDDARKGE